MYVYVYLYVGESLCKTNKTDSLRESAAIGSAIFKVSHFYCFFGRICCCKLAVRNTICKSLFNCSLCLLCFAIHAQWAITAFRSFRQANITHICMYIYSYIDMYVHVYIHAQVHRYYHIQCSICNLLVAFDVAHNGYALKIKKEQKTNFRNFFYSNLVHCYKIIWDCKFTQ